MYRSVFAITALVASMYIGAASAGLDCGNDRVAQLGLDPVGIIEHWNYTAKEHWVTSEDGYIINMVRITGKKDAPSNCAKKEPVIVHHGLLCTSTDWLVMDAPKTPGGPGALAFMLVDAGYDVWLPSARGSALSQDHTTLSTSDVKYWQFSLNEMGKFDVPAMIDYILAETGFPQLLWAGHSQGCGMFFAANHYHPDLKDKVRKAALLAPAAKIDHSYSPVVLGLSLLPQQIVEAAFIATSHGGALPDGLTKLVHKYAPKFCSSLGDVTKNAVCQNALYLIAGVPKDDKYNINGCNIARVVSHTPTTTSARTITHYVQGRQTGEFKPQCNNIENSMPGTTEALATFFNPLVTNPLDKLLDLMNSYGLSSTMGRKKRGILSAVGGVVGGVTGTLNQTYQALKNLDYSPLNHCESPYLLSNTQMPALVLCGDSDSLVTLEDCKATANALGNLYNTIPISNFEHLDFTYANNATESVNRPVLDFFNEGKPQCN